MPLTRLNFVFFGISMTLLSRLSPFSQSRSTHQARVRLFSSWALATACSFSACGCVSSKPPAPAASMIEAAHAAQQTEPVSPRAIQSTQSSIGVNEERKMEIASEREALPRRAIPLREPRSTFVLIPLDDVSGFADGVSRSDAANGQRPSEAAIAACATVVNMMERMRFPGAQCFATHAALHIRTALIPRSFALSYEELERFHADAVLASGFALQGSDKPAVRTIVVGETNNRFCMATSALSAMSYADSIGEMADQTHSLGLSHFKEKRQISALRDSMTQAREEVPCLQKPPMKMPPWAQMK